MLTRKERRIANSMMLVRYVTPFAVGWYVIAWYLDAPRLEIAALIATFGFLAGIALHKFRFHNLARIIWLLAANIAIFLASLVVHPAGYMAFILLPAAGVPFLIYSMRTNLKMVAGFVGLSVSMWFFGWWTSYEFLAPFDVDLETAATVVAPGSAVTVFGVVLFEFGYFVFVAGNYARNLVQSQRRAEIANEAKSALLMGMSHEMRTPLNAITGLAELVQLEARDIRPVNQKDLQEKMEIVLGASSDLLAMMDNMLAFASIAGTALNANMSEIRVEDVIERVLQRHKHLVSSKCQELQVNLQDHPVVMADPDLLFSALSQIFDNASKYTPAGGKISISSEPGPGDTVRIVFRDSGQGFSESDMHRAFNPFERLKQANGTQSGAGIGLALVQAYVEAMGGTAGIDAHEKCGGIAWVELNRP